LCIDGGSIFTTKTKKSSAFFQQMDDLNDYLTTTKCYLTDPELCVKLRTFLQYANTKHDPMHDIFQKVSPGLRGRLAWQVRWCHSWALVQYRRPWHPTRGTER